MEVPPGGKYPAVILIPVLFLVTAALMPASAAYTGMEHAEACTCNDLADMQATRDEVENLYQAFLSVLGSFDMADPPDDWTEASNRASDIAFGPSPGGGSGSGSHPISGFDRNDQPWIDPGFAQAHCSQVSQSYIEHELEHIRYLNEVLDPNPWTGFINGIHAKIDPRWFAREMTKSDVNAYHTQLQFLNGKIGSMKQECEDKKAWECVCSKQTFDSEAACWGSCHASLGCFNHVCRETAKSYAG